MSLEKLLKKIPVSLTALVLSCGSGDGQGGEGAGCTSDYDCKGDRICSSGQCVILSSPPRQEPPNNNPPQNQPPSSKKDIYQSSGYDTINYPAFDTSWWYPSPDTYSSWDTPQSFPDTIYFDTLTPSAFCNNPQCTINDNCVCLVYESFTTLDFLNDPMWIGYGRYEGPPPNASSYEVNPNFKTVDGNLKMSVGAEVTWATIGTGDSSWPSLEDSSEISFRISGQATNATLEFVVGGFIDTQQGKYLGILCNSAPPFSCGLVDFGSSPEMFEQQYFPNVDPSEWHDSYEIIWQKDGQVTIKDGSCCTIGSFFAYPLKKDSTFGLQFSCISNSSQEGECLFGYVMLNRQK